MTGSPSRASAVADDEPVKGSPLDTALFVFSGLTAIWLAALLFQESFQLNHWWFSIIFWAVLAYLVLPRLHRILSRIYLPDYFIGRGRTSDGLLGDPINVTLLGSDAAVHTAMLRAGWTRADEIDATSTRRIIVSTVTRRSYDEAPVSPLFVFGRQQDFTYQQEVNGSPGKRHHIRFWRCPPEWVLPGGTDVDWLAAGTYDKSVGFSLFTLQITHKIETDIDEERDYVIDSLTSSEPGATVRILRNFSTGYHSRNGGGDNIQTDGHLPVIDLRPVDVGSPPAALAPADSRDRRPAPTTFGASLVFLRGLTALMLAVSLWTGDLTVVAGQEVDEYVSVVAGVVGAFALVEVLLAWLLLRGSNRVRIAAMLLSVAAIIAAAADVVNGGPGITLSTNLIGLGLDILLIIALTSQRSRTFAHRRSRSRRRNRRLRTTTEGIPQSTDHLHEV
ncbi:LssY C-terminal domain-containing protein [Arthrobacter sp. CAN_A212]|uniref:LssY C-terminal domain-containing protein n=1 Tax=Arthrobacter sp. CAN_A212 TaxID=2787719 RepID=UPI0018CA4097